MALKSFSQHSIHQRISLLFTLLGALVLILVVTGLFVSLNGWLNARRVIEQNNIATHALEAVKHFTFERGRTNVVLRGNSLISDKNRIFLDERRAKGDAAIRAVIDAAAPRFPLEAGAVEEAWATVVKLRAAVEQDFVTPLGDRDPKLPQNWFSVANALVGRLEGLLIQASQVEKADYSFARLANLRIYALQFRNVVGSESTRLASELSAERVPDSGVLFDVALLRGDSQRTWTYIEQLAQAVAVKEISLAISQVEKDFFGRLRPLQNRIISASQDGKPADFKIDVYTQAAVPALDSIIEMVDSVDLVTRDYVSNQYQVARWWLAGSVAALLCLFGFLYLAKADLADKLLKPLQSILSRIRILGGVSKDFQPYEKHGDLSAIDRALDVLDKSLAEIEQAQDSEKSSRAALLKSEQRLRAAIDTIGEAFAIFDEEDRLAYFNEEYRKVYPSIADVIVVGNTFEKIIRTWAERGYCPEEDIESWVKGRLAVHQQGATLVQKTDGGRWMRIVERPTPDGQIVGFRVDITELMRAKEAAEVSSRAKSLFLATMSHEIRTPLNGVQGMAQMLLMPDISEAERLDFAQTILDSGELLLNLLSDILDLSNIEAGQMAFDKTPFEPDLLLHETVALFGEAIHEKGLGMSVVWCGEDLRYEGDPQRLRQMLSNYLGNALKFTATGTISVEGCEVRQEDDFSVLEFSVTDTGPGIPADKLELLFQPFSQVDGSMTRHFGGCGLGLSIVRGLACLMGGEVGVESHEGHGSRFWFRVQVRRFDSSAEAKKQKS